METKDHLALGKYLLYNTENNFTPLQKKLFLIGNVLPDVWLFSYAVGIAERKNLKGHIHSNAKKRVEKHIRYIKKHKDNKYKNSFMLGVLMHYLADSFTYPHSDHYAFGISQHKKYEHELHRMMWKEIFLSNNQYMKEIHLEHLDAMVKKAYKGYTGIIHTPKSDCKYILEMAEKVFLSGLYTVKELQKGM